MKLMCVNHGKRALVLPSAAVVHRSDGTACDGMVNIGYFTGTGQEVLNNKQYEQFPPHVRYMRTSDDYIWDRPLTME